MRIQAKAKVQITVEVDASVWGGECSIAQLHEQAATSGLQHIQQLIGGQVGFTIIGSPKVLGIITNEV